MKRTNVAAPAPDLSGTHVWLVLMKAHRALEQVALRSVASLEVGLSDFGVLEVLLHKGSLPVNEIGRRVGLTSGAITIAVDRMEASGCVVREAHPTDRRARVVRLTPRGREQAQRLFAKHRRAMDAAGAALSSRERASLLGLLRKLGMAAETSRSRKDETKRSKP